MCAQSHGPGNARAYTAVPRRAFRTVITRIKEASSSTHVKLGLALAASIKAGNASSYRACFKYADLIALFYQRSYPGTKGAANSQQSCDQTDIEQVLLVKGKTDVYFRDTTTNQVNMWRLPAEFLPV